MPYEFAGIPSDCAAVAVESVYLRTSDYCLGCHTCGKQLVGPDAIGIERKTLSDLYGSFTHGRERFERAMLRLSSEFGYAALLVEADWTQISNPNTHLKYPTQALPRSVTASMLSWSVRMGFHVFTAGDRTIGERLTFRLLEWKFRQLVSQKKCDELTHKGESQ